MINLLELAWLKKIVFVSHEYDICVHKRYRTTFVLRIEFPGNVRLSYLNNTLLTYHGSELMFI